jgi:NAD(P)-dependent dehydrogenase (short-subunit alcohol dehydrogenase family)
MGKLDGKVAIVTGAARGIGKAIAAAFGNEGAKVVMADKDAAGLATTVSAFEKLGIQAIGVPTDVTVEQQIVDLFAKTMAKFGRLDLLVNNAGVFGGGPISEMSAEAWDRVISVDLRAPFLCTREALKIMKKQSSGRIINISSISARRQRFANSSYSVSKAGIAALTEATALEGRPIGINCGCLYPGEVYHEGRPIEDQKEPAMTTDETAAAVLYMACQPPHVNVLELLQLPREQLYLGRG